jgi:hypothetical protein
LDAVQHGKVEVMDVEVNINNETSQNLPQPFNDAAHQLTNVAEDLERVAKDVFTGEKSLVALLGHAPKIREMVLRLEKEHPELMHLDEVSFREKHKQDITLITQRVRISLWQEYEMAHLNNRMMRARQMYAGVCSETAFYHLINNPVRLAFILTAPSDYIVTLKEAHDAGLSKLRELFTAKVVDEEGYMNPKAAEIMIKAFAILDARLKGAVIQRVDQRVLTANVEAPTPGFVGIPKDMEKLEEEIAKARQQLSKITKSVRLSPTVEQLQYEARDLEFEEPTTGDAAAKAKSLGAGE